MTTKSQSTTTKLEASEPTPCDYRNKHCAAYGVTIDGKWICNNHICEQRQRCWLNSTARVSANGVPTVDAVDRAIVLRELMRISCASSYCVCVPMAVEKIRALAAASPVAPDNYTEIQCAGCGRSTDVGLLLCPSCVDRGHSPEGES